MVGATGFHGSAVLAAAGAVAVGAVAAAGVETTHCLLPSIPLEEFETTTFAFACIGPPAGTITRTYTNFIYTTLPGQDAADIRLTIRAPSEGLPEWTLTGEQLGWAGAGTFTAQVETETLNGPFDFGEPPAFSVFLVTLDMTTNGLLAGKFTTSTYNVEIEVQPPCPWDLDLDDVVGSADLRGLLVAWGTDPGGPPDFDSNGVVDVIDFLDLLAHWGPCP